MYVIKVKKGRYGKDIFLYKYYFFGRKLIYKTFMFSSLYNKIIELDLEYNKIYINISYKDLFDLFIDEFSLNKNKGGNRI